MDSFNLGSDSVTAESHSTIPERLYFSQRRAIAKAAGVEVTAECNAIIQATLDAMRAQEGAESLSLDAARYRKIKPLLHCAHFYPEDMDLPDGVALIFIAPKGTRVSADLDATLDAMPGDANRG